LVFYLGRAHRYGLIMTPTSFFIFIFRLIFLPSFLFYVFVLFSCDWVCFITSFFTCRLFFSWSLRFPLRVFLVALVFEYFIYLPFLLCSFGCPHGELFRFSIWGWAHSYSLKRTPTSFFIPTFQGSYFFYLSISYVFVLFSCVLVCFITSSFTLRHFLSWVLCFLVCVFSCFFCWVQYFFFPSFSTSPCSSNFLGFQFTFL